jgi:hypothetical protein
MSETREFSHVVDLNNGHWIKLLYVPCRCAACDGPHIDEGISRANRLLRAWIGEGPAHNPHVERAPKEGIKHGSQSDKYLGVIAISLKIGEKSENLFDDYEVQDGSFITTQTTTSRFEFNMMLNAFSKKGINGAL